MGQSSQGQTPTRPRDKRDKMANLLWNQTEKDRFVPGTGRNLSRGGVPFVPGTVRVCPGRRPAQNVYVYWFFFAAICFKTLVLLGNDPVTPSNCSENTLVLFVQFFGFVSPFWLLILGAQSLKYDDCESATRALVIGLSHLENPNLLK